MAQEKPRRRFEFRSLSARIYFCVGAMLVLAIVTVVQISPWITRIFYSELYSSFAIWMTSQVSAHAREPADMQRELERVTHAISLEATVYDEAGRVVASTAAPPLASLPAGSESGGVRMSGWDMMEVDLPDGAPIAGSIVWRRAAPPSLYLVIATVGGVLSLIVALGTIPLARSMARPLRELRDMARRFGEGALSTRARSARADEIGDLARSFDEMASRIEASRRAEREMLAGVSHELRTPLARIRVALDLVSEHDAVSSAAHLPGIHSDLAEVERLLEDVLTAARLDLARPEDAFPGLQKDVVLASELAGVVARRFAANHPDRVLEVDVQEIGETALDVDATLLGRALQNLLENAAKYSSAPLRLEATVLGERLRFRVIDRGVGISEADLALVFTPFFRGDPSRTRATGGVGLGLSLARRIARAHGGEVSIESRLGAGTTVAMELPVLGL